jgi:HEAT repeat protein
VAGSYCVAILQETCDDEIRKKLCLGLCLLLKQASNGHLLQACKQKLILGGKKNKQENTKIENIFNEIANENPSSLVRISALAFASTSDWKLFVKLALGDSMAAAVDMELCQFILADLDKAGWEDIVGPAALQKLKAKPESVLAMLEGMTKYLNPIVLSTSKIVVDEYLAVLVKNLKSPREAVREQSSLVLQYIGKAAIEAVVAENQDATLSKECLSMLVEWVADTKALTQPHQRRIVYETLYHIGANVRGTGFAATSSGAKSNMQQKTELVRVFFASKVISAVLVGTSCALAKEARTATDNRDQGVKALLVWMVIAQQNPDGGGNGYDEALSYIRKPVVAKNSGDAVAILGLMVQQIHPDTMEKLVLDLWKDSKFSTGLDSFVEDANKKQSTKSSIAPVDGLMAVYLNLLYATVSSSKLPTLIEQALLAGSSPLGKTSFVYGAAITNALSSNPLVGCVLPQVIGLYTKLASSPDSRSTILKASSAEIRALACCAAFPCAIGRKSPAESIEATIQTVLDHNNVSEELIGALVIRVNELSLEYSNSLELLNTDRQSREDSKLISIKGKGSPMGAHGGACVGSIRRIARMLLIRELSGPALAQALILLHGGTSHRSSGQQRKALVKYTTEAFTVLKNKISENKRDLLESVALVIAESLSSDSIANGCDKVSDGIFAAAQSLVISLGLVACSFSPLAGNLEDEDVMIFAFVMELLTKGVCVRLAAALSTLLKDVEGLSSMDVGIYRSAAGTLYEEQNDDPQNHPAIKDSRKGRRTDDEEWEVQMKKELAKKKMASSEGTKVLTAEEKKKIAEQDKKRIELLALIHVRFERILASIESLTGGSDIEIGNSCLHSLSPGILKLSVLDCPAMRDIPGMQERALRSLTCLSGCVYEIQEEHAPMMALALVISCHNVSSDPETFKTSNSLGFEVFPLPSPCEPAATTVFEMDEFQEELSGNSFCFLFPVIQAALCGPRTTPGCEGALRVLERHTVLLAGDQSDPNVKLLRPDMVSSVLELLKHDRAQAYNDPDPYNTLVACYKTDDEDPSSSFPPLSTKELAPLLDERGALGGKNCRLAAMIALGSIALHHQKLVNSNPLIESRIWLNCFDKDDTVQAEARKTWGIIYDQELSDENLPAPSALYAVPLLGLLSNKNNSIAIAAAKAYSYGMKAHPDTINHNVVKLCSMYIDSFPSPGNAYDMSSTASPFPNKKTLSNAAPAPAKQPLLSTGLKKKTVKKSALQVAGIGQPKKSTKKKMVTSALLKPKQERTLDQAALESQFKMGPQKTQPEKDSPEKATIRLGIMKALSEIPPTKLDMDIETLKQLTSFLMAYGIADEDEGINNCSRNTLRDIIAAYGASEQAIGFLLPHLDAILKSGSARDDSLGNLSKEKIPHGAVAADRRKEGAVVALGSVAIHLKGPENATKIDNSVDMLLSSLHTTPNPDVQASVADALSKLMKKGNTQDRVEQILNDLLKSCLDGETTAIRRGAGLGVAAVVKGSGISCLKKYGIVGRLENACASGSSGNKEGSLFAIQSLCSRLGLLFEPYVIVLLPSLLKCFGDGSDSVRRQASEAVGVIMSKLSAHGVKLVLPAVLMAFNDSSWRTKQASINMLGSMSHLAPKQLASALPKVVPKLTEAFADTHPKVKASAQGALEEISSVVRNPEIHEISPVLLKALTDPADKTLCALEALIETEFLHAIDAPSLALIVPILHRGLRDRAATTKRYGALITGNICTMINDPRDFVPYLPTLIPDLKSSLLDPIPDVRSIAAKAFGSLTRGLGEDTLPDLRPWLIQELQADGLSSAERSGAAQGLTEVLIASGTSVVENVMQDDILPLASHASPSHREGVLWVLCFLPPALGQGFTALLDDSLPPLINGLSDENEQVREVAMRAGRVLIKSHGKVHFDKILPILQNGMSDADFRIRYSSLMLLGDLLSMIGGTSVLRTDGDTQDDIRRAERAQAQLTLVLGIQTRNRVLSDVYLARSDNAVVVRQAAVQVWKTVVSVTARTLRQILPVLVGRVVSDLASGEAETTETAGKCLGDIVGKLGDSVLPEVIPVLRNSLYDGETNTRRGVCVGLSEVIGSSTKDQILRFIDIIVKVVQDALCDDDASVREMAASSFQNLYNLVGSRAMDEVVPALMVALENTDDEIGRERALNGLTGILSIRSKELLPYIIPKLIQQPITENHAKALSSIATVTSTTLYFHYRSIIPALLMFLAVESEDMNSCVKATRNCVHSLFRSGDEAGVNMMISEVTGNCSSDKPEMRRESCWMMEVMIDERKSVLPKTLHLISG